MNDLKQLVEPQLLQRHQPDSLGYYDSADTNDTYSSAYYGMLVVPPVEDATIRLASCFLRCVLNYAQEPEERNELLY
ncbi:hypothetical protein CP532_4012 [Ophiocordyceps camponoti-leonardi (nom. inval.)]|nr:hypothetical protein CP532_4012 [Ophiocordyceps camponoti-leonardi (nom. inval.)]